MSVLNTSYQVRCDILESESNVSIENGAMHVYDNKLKVHLNNSIKTVVTNFNSATFFDTTTQTNAGATTANQVLINSTQEANGFSIGEANNIIVDNAATYFFSLSLQLAFTGGASNYNVTVWYSVDDVIVPNSAFTFTTTGAQNDQTLATITDTIALNSGQSLKFYWWSQATGMKILSTAVGTNPTRPLSPSVNLNIFNVA
jgi:hypothetical protein